jgi:hypothetical protein
MRALAQGIDGKARERVVFTPGQVRRRIREAAALS